MRTILSNWSWRHNQAVHDADEIFCRVHWGQRARAKPAGNNVPRFAPLSRDAVGAPPGPSVRGQNHACRKSLGKFICKRFRNSNVKRRNASRNSLSNLDGPSFSTRKGQVKQWHDIPRILVDVTGFEPATPCLQSNATLIRKAFRLATSQQESTLRHDRGMWPGVSGCDRLFVGSLQKSLQSVSRCPGRFLLNRKTSGTVRE
jgi:hypothetical protein